MLTDRQMTTLRKITVRLRELKPYLERIENEIEEKRILLPERQWRSGIDDEMIQIAVSLDFASISLDEVVNYIAEITGEDELPSLQRTSPAPLPDTWPTYEEVDAKRRRAANVIRERRSNP